MSGFMHVMRPDTQKGSGPPRRSRERALNKSASFISKHARAHFPTWTCAEHLYDWHHPVLTGGGGSFADPATTQPPALAASVSQQLFKWAFYLFDYRLSNYPRRRTGCGIQAQVFPSFLSKKQQNMRWRRFRRRGRKTSRQVHLLHCVVQTQNGTRIPNSLNAPT